jgi:S-(hydroxymethyl)glutathione dehydrogenase / alcohol dehydrogenase
MVFSDMLPTTTSGAVLTKLGKPLEIIKGIRLPELKAGQVLIEVHYAGLCHSQLKEARGDRGEDPYVPHMLGHEGTGRVLSVGAGVEKVSVGDKVVLGWIKSSGLDASGTQYLGPNGQVINAGGVTTFSRHTVVSENRVVKLPPNTPMDLAVLYGCALPTGAGIVFNEIAINTESTIVVFGLGGIGLSALVAAKTFTPSMLVGIDVESVKLELGTNLGATHVINAKDTDAVEAVLALTNGKGADFVVEASGLAKTIEQGFQMTRRDGGQLVFATHPKEGDMIELDPFELICGKSIRGSWGGSSKPDVDIPKMDLLYKEGKLPLEAFVSHSYSLEDVNVALSDLEQRKIVRALIDMEQE